MKINPALLNKYAQQPTTEAPKTDPFIVGALTQAAKLVESVLHKIQASPNPADYSYHINLIKSLVETAIPFRSPGHHDH